MRLSRRSRRRVSSASMSDRFRVGFEPQGRSVEVASGTPLLTAVREAGIWLASVCGGEGTCGRCRVLVEAGELPPPSDAERRALSGTEIAAGERLACRVPVSSAMAIHVPKASLIGGQRLQLAGPERAIVIDPVVRAYAVQATPPTLRDPTSDLERVTIAATAHRLRGLHADPSVVRQLTPLARRTGWDVTLLVRAGGEVVGVMRPRRRAAGLAVDLGTTKIAGYLLDLETGRELAAEGVMNPQIPYGEDVVTRLAHAARSPGGADELARLVRDGLDQLLGALCETAGIARDEVAEGCIVGNTAMYHLEKLSRIPATVLDRAIPGAQTQFPSGLGTVLKNELASFPGAWQKIGQEYKYGRSELGKVDFGAAEGLPKLPLGLNAAPGAEPVMKAMDFVSNAIFRTLGAEDVLAREPAYARSLGAPAPAQVSADEVEDPDARFYAMQLRGASNAKVKHELGLRPRRREWLGDTK